MLQLLIAISVALLFIFFIIYLTLFICSICYLIFMIYIFCLLYKKTGSDYCIQLIPIYGYYKLCKQFNVSKRVTQASLISLIMCFISALLALINSLFLVFYFIFLFVTLFIFIIISIALYESIRLSFSYKGKPMNAIKFWIGLLFGGQSIIELAINPKYVYTFGTNKSVFLYDEYFYDNRFQNTNSISNQKVTENNVDLLGGNDE